MTGADVLDLRQRLGWTQTQLGAAVGVHYVSVCRWENGHRVPSDLAVRELKRLARRLANAERNSPEK